MRPDSQSWAGRFFLALPFAPEAVRVLTLRNLWGVDQQFLSIDLARRFRSCRMLRRDSSAVRGQSHVGFPAVRTIVDHLVVLSNMTPNNISIFLPPTTNRYVLELHWQEGALAPLSCPVVIKNAAKVTDWVLILSSSNMRREPILPMTCFTTVSDILVTATPSLLAGGSLIVVGLEEILPDQIGGPPHVKGRRGDKTFTHFKSILKNAVVSAFYDEGSFDQVLQATRTMSKATWGSRGTLESWRRI
ncbi:uncharacterized protein LOC62_04G005254 [Vanrija pseudolonga]|uniref:Uncharacterized protein n=1 Tax=Vanrija pseudolonga TaxID=143232 RepID=A0AAF1BR54_9TREE|nr:hypothetical protein LOC62_04G005254 [Vanrija pseudolonga]